jgi:hypothetical protein
VIEDDDMQYFQQLGQWEEAFPEIPYTEEELDEMAHLSMLRRLREEGL